MASEDVKARELRRLIIEVSARAKVGHIGSALGICEILSVLFSRVLRSPAGSDPDRDRFILSKGHAALALYSALHLLGRMTRGTLDTYCRDGSLLGVHPEHALDGVDVSTGSLGLGLSIGAGLAWGGRLHRSNRRVYVLLSDAECNEGSVWESVMFAGHHRLSTLTAIVDDNGMQALGATRGILDLRPLEEKWRAFGWDARTVDGHNERELEQSLLEAPAGRPRAVIAQTVLGKGVSFMEGRLDWHYLPVSEEQAARALREIAGEA